MSEDRRDDGAEGDDVREAGTPMDHDRIARNEVIRRYVRDALPEEAREAFEDHLVACAGCQDAVEAEASLYQGFQALGAEEAAAREIVAASIAGAIVGHRRRFAPWALLAALGIVLAVGPYTAWRIQGMRGKAALAEAQARIARLDAEVTRLAEAGSPAGGAMPSTNTPLHYLSLVRDGTTRVDRLPLPAAGQPLILVMEAEAPGAEDVRIAITREGAPPWEGGGLRANDFGAFVVTLPPGWARAGRHDVVLEATWPQRPPAVVARFAFALAAP